MIIRNISLHTEYGVLSSEDNVRFNLNVSFINDYLSRAVRKQRIETDNSFNFISVCLCGREKPDEIKDIFKAIDINELLDLKSFEQYKSLKHMEDRCEYYLGLLEQGYERAARLKPIPISKLMSMHTSFRENGYRNEWLFKKIISKEYDLTLLMKCYYTSFDFRLELEAYKSKSKQPICQGIILRTPPASEFFSHILRSVRINTELMEIIDFLGFANISINLNQIANGVFNVTFHDRENMGDWYKGWDTVNKEAEETIQRITW